MQAGILSPDDAEVRSVELAILADPALTERQKQSMLEVYQAFRSVTGVAGGSSLDARGGDGPLPGTSQTQAVDADLEHPSEGM